MHRSAPLCTLQFAVDFYSVLDGGEGGESEGENKRGGGVGGWVWEGLEQGD
jgi:hypothetical protein